MLQTLVVRPFALAVCWPMHSTAQNAAVYHTVPRRIVESWNYNGLE